jgi:prophage antirepressor-like protein
MVYTTLAAKVKENIEVFENPLFGMIRTLEIDGKPYFVASDVAKVLGYTNSSKAIKDHCRWVTKRYVPHPQSADKKIEVNIIPQGDVMRLAAKSELPGAEKFESWIFDDVIPTVLNHGIYATDSVINKILDDPDFGIKVLTELKEERIARMTAEEEKEKLQQELDYSKDWYSIKRVAAMNGVDWKTFNWRKLKEKSIELGYGVKKIFDANYGEVNTYHRDAWEAAYPEYEI